VDSFGVYIPHQPRHTSVGFAESLAFSFIPACLLVPASSFPLVSTSEGGAAVRGFDLACLYSTI